MGLRDFTFADVIERNAQLHGGQLAFVAGGQRISHGQYRERVEHLAGALAQLGLTVGDRIAVLAQNSLTYVELFGTAARLGLIMVPVNWRMSKEEVAYVIKDTTPKIVVVSEEYVPVIEAWREHFSFVERYFTLGEKTPAFDDLAALSATETAPVADIPSDSGFVIIHTAAVEGRLRGALLTHSGLLHFSAQFAELWQLAKNDVHLGVLPLFHAAGLGLLLAVQQAGGASVIMPRFDPLAALQAIEREKVTVFFAFPPMLQTLLDKASEEATNLSSLRHLTGLDTPETIARFETRCPQAAFWAVYGQSELSGLVTMSPYRERPGSAGRPAGLNCVSIVDDFDQHLAVGQIGEIVVRGPMVFAGYWNCEADNAVTFRNGWHHTGDMGYFDQDGYLWYCGRSPAKELIKPGGENVYPTEVEKALLAHPAIAEAVVFGIPDARWGEAIKAVCVCRGGQTASEAELIEFVGNRIARYKRPKRIVFAAALPKSTQGLLDRAKIKQEFADA